MLVLVLDGFALLNQHVIFEDRPGKVITSSHPFIFITRLACIVVVAAYGTKGKNIWQSRTNGMHHAHTESTFALARFGSALLARLIIPIIMYIMPAYLHIVQTHVVI